MDDVISKRKKILYIITKSNLGGAQRHVFDLALHFSKTNDVVVALGGTGELKAKLEQAGITTISVLKLDRDVNFINDLAVIWNLFSIIRKVKPDIVHLHSSKIGLFGSFVARIMRVKKIVFTGHGWSFNETRPTIFKKILLILHWLTVLFSDITIAVSNKTKRDIDYLPFVLHKIVRIYNGVRKEDYFEKEAARNILQNSHSQLQKIQPGALWIGTTSELHKNKGLHHMCEAMKELIKEKNIAFIVLGEGRERTNLENYINEHNLQHYVFLPGFVNDAKKYLKAFDVFSLTSTTEALPYSILDAGMAEIPVIASDVGGIPEIIMSDYSGILVRPRSTEDIIAAVLKIEREIKRGSFAKNLYRTVSQKFNIETMFNEIEKIYLS